MGIDFEELKKKYSCGPLLKKVNCNDRTIRVEGLDIGTAERINERVAASLKGSFTGQHISEEGGPIVRGPVKTKKIKK